MPEKERDYRNREITWSEIDKRKDRSSHVSEDPKPFGKNKEKADWLRKMALKEANKHFQGKQGTPAHDNAVDALAEKFREPKNFRVWPNNIWMNTACPSIGGPSFSFWIMTTRRWLSIC